MLEPQEYEPQFLADLYFRLCEEVSRDLALEIASLQGSADAWVIEGTWITPQLVASVLSKSRISGVFVMEDDPAEAVRARLRRKSPHHLRTARDELFADLSFRHGTWIRTQCAE